MYMNRSQHWQEYRIKALPNSPNPHKGTFKLEYFRRGEHTPNNISLISAFASGTESWWGRGREERGREGGWGGRRRGEGRHSKRLPCWCLLTYYFYVSIIRLVTQRQMPNKKLITFPNLICKQAFISCLSRRSSGTLSIQIIVLSQWCKPLNKAPPSQSPDAQCHWTQGADN